MKKNVNNNTRTNPWVVKKGTDVKVVSKFGPDFYASSPIPAGELERQHTRRSEGFCLQFYFVIICGLYGF